MLELNQFSKKFQEKKNPYKTHAGNRRLDCSHSPIFSSDNRDRALCGMGVGFKCSEFSLGMSVKSTVKLSTSTMCSILTILRRNRGLTTVYAEFHTLSFNMLDISLPFRASLMRLRFLPNAFSILSFFSGLQESCLHLFMLTSILILNT